MAKLTEKENAQLLTEATKVVFDDKLKAFRKALNEWLTAVHIEAQIAEPYGEVVENVEKARKKVEQMYADILTVSLLPK